MISAMGKEVEQGKGDWGLVTILNGWSGLTS